MEYIGEVEEIVELDYRHSCVVVFVCRWLKAKYRGPNATVKTDKWGFTLANFEACEGFGKESFVFPKHCQQVFYMQALESPGWRVVLRRDVRGKQVGNADGEMERSPLFGGGTDDDHEGLRPPEIISEASPNRSSTVREVSREDLFEDRPAEDDFFDRDIGESLGPD